MKFSAQCSCGAKIELEDRGTFINPGGKPNENGKIFQLELTLDDWLRRHEGCLTGKEPE